MATPITPELIAEAATQAQRVKVDKTEVESHPLPDMIAADNHKTASAIGLDPARIISFRKIRGAGPGGFG